MKLETEISKAFYEAFPESKRYEGWKFNSGNYLFTTDTK